MAQLGKVDPSEVDRYTPPDPDGTGIERHIGIVRVLTDRLKSRRRGVGCDRDDLFQMGMIGAWRAAQSFEPERNLKFSTYAAYWIRQHATRELEDRDTTVRIPVHIQAARRKSRLAPRTQPRSLDAPLKADSESTLGDCLPDPHAKPPDARIEAAERKVQLARLIDASGLSARERRVLELRFGIAPELRGDDLALGAIGTAFGCSRERVRQIEAIALGKLRKAARRLERFRAPAREAEAP